jgi:hypothetical protein
MYFSPDGLALGAGTILLPAVGPRRLTDLQGEEARLLTLLAATYGKAISPSVLGDLTAAQAEQLGLWASRLLTPLAAGAGAVEAFRLIFIPKDNRIRVEGDINGLPGGRYSWNRDETEIHITYRDADGEQRTFTAQLKEREFLGPRGQVVGRVLPNDTVAIDADALPGRPANDNEPKLCPRPQPDKRTNDKGLAYEAFMRPIVNPFMPTPLGLGYKLMSPSTGEAVEFDDCEQRSGTMIDYKDQYWELLTSGIREFVVENLKKQALRQIEAAGARAIRGYFAEKETADFVRELFDNDPNIRGAIVIEHRPFPGNRR